MTVVEGPGTFQRLDHVSIPLPDGTVLGARIWVPEGAETHKVPAILEYAPSCQRGFPDDRTAACPIRGSGASGGCGAVRFG